MRKTTPVASARAEVKATAWPALPEETPDDARRDRGHRPGGAEPEQTRSAEQRVADQSQRRRIQLELGRHARTVA